MPAAQNLRLYLTRSPSRPNTLQIGRTISTNAGNVMAALAALRVKVDCTTFACIFI